MKKFAIASVVLSSFVSAAHADTLAVDTAVGFESRYVFRGVQLAETSIQPSIQLNYGNFYGGAWFNLPVGDDDLVVTPGGEELDFYAGYGFALNESVHLDVGFTYYTYPDLASGFFDVFEEDGDGLGANTVEIFAGLSFDTALTPTFYVYRDFMLDTLTIEGSVSHSIPLAEKTSFDLGAALGYVVDDDPADYLYGNISADLTYALSDHGSLAAGVRYGGADIAGGSFIDDSIGGTLQSSGFWWGISVGGSF